VRQIQSNSAKIGWVGSPTNVIQRVLDQTHLTWADIEKNVNWKDELRSFARKHLGGVTILGLKDKAVTAWPKVLDEFW